VTWTLWLATYLIHSTLIYGGVIACRRAIRDDATTEWLWRSALTLPLASATAATSGRFGMWNIAVGAFDATGGLRLSAGHAIARGWTAGDVLVIAAYACLAVGGLLLVRDLAARRLFIRRLGVRVDAGEPLAATLDDIRRRAGIRRVVRLTCTPALSSPVTIGAREICLPARAARDLEPRQLRALLSHELAHLIRHDNRWFGMLACLESVLFAQPINRLARRELQRLAELACDRWAATLLSDPNAMAQCLVEVAGWTRAAPPAPFAGAIGGGRLSERVRRLIDQEEPARSFRGTRSVALAAVCLCLPLLPGLATSTPRAAARIAPAPVRARGIAESDVRATVERGIRAGIQAGLSRSLHAGALNAEPPRRFPR
jgi:beta-lactamase regulating signal transducer with metallopeptidase domain